MLSAWISRAPRTLRICRRRAAAVMRDGRSELREEPREAKISRIVFGGSFAARFAFPAESPNTSTFKRDLKMQSVYPRSQPERARSTSGRVKKYTAWAAPTYFDLFSQLFIYLFFSLRPRVLSWPLGWDPALGLVICQVGWIALKGEFCIFKEEFGTDLKRWGHLGTLRVKDGFKFLILLW